MRIRSYPTAARPGLLGVLASALLVALVASPVAAKETFDSGDIAPGETFAFTFRTEHPQGHTYHCHPHPSMEGMVHVNPDSDGTTTIHHVDIVEGSDAASWGYSIEHLMVEVGDTVVWTNKGTMVHTVTEGGDHAGHDEGGDASVDSHEDHEHSTGAPGMGTAAMVAGLLAAVVLARTRRI